MISFHAMLHLVIPLSSKSFITNQQNFSPGSKKFCQKRKVLKLIFVSRKKSELQLVHCCQCYFLVFRTFQQICELKTRTILSRIFSKTASISQGN